MSTIDPDDYVSDGGEGSLEFNDPKQNAKFRLGVRMAIYQWEELGLAGGLVPSGERRMYASGTVLGDLFSDLQKVDIDFIDERLFHCSADELDPEFQDNDWGLVTGDLIIKMYRECREYDFSRIDDMYLRFQEKMFAEQVKRRVAIEEDPKHEEGPNKQRDEDDSHPTEHNDTRTKQGTDPKQPVTDEDGFDLVTK